MVIVPYQVRLSLKKNSQQIIAFGKVLGDEHSSAFLLTAAASKQMFNHPMEDGGSLYIRSRDLYRFE